MELALSKNLLQENSVLYALLCDTVTSLIKAEVERKKSGESGKKMHPKGMHFHPVVVRWCAELAGKCGQGGYNLVREILPIPSLTTVNSYRQSHNSYNVVFIAEVINLEEKEPTQTNSDHMFEYSINGDSSTDDNSTSYDTDGELGMASCRPMA